MNAFDDLIAIAYMALDDKHFCQWLQEKRNYQDHHLEELYQAAANFLDIKPGAAIPAREL